MCLSFCGRLVTLAVVGITYFECTGCETEGNVSKLSCQLPQNLHAMTEYFEEESENLHAVMKNVLGHNFFL